MKKTLYAFLITGITIAAITLLIVSYPKEPIQDQSSSNGVVRDDEQLPVSRNEIPNAKMPAGTNPVTSESLIGTTWVWEKTVKSEGSNVLPKKAGMFGIAFGVDGRLIGKTDCNGFFGSYNIGSDGIIAFGSIASTLMYCEGSQETEFTKSLSDVARYELTNDGKLVLILKDNLGSIFFNKK